MKKTAKKESKKGARRPAPPHKKALKLVAPPAPQDPADPELVAKIEALAAVTQVHALLQSGTFPFALFSKVHASIMFMEKMHGEMSPAVLEHPDIGKFPDLAELKKNYDAKKKAEQDLKEKLAKEEQAGEEVKDEK